MRMVWLIYHSVDLDGECSGALLRRFHEAGGMTIDKDFKMLPMNYGDEFDESIIKNGDEVIFADFCFQPYERIQKLNERCKVLVYDHHKSANADLKKYNIEGDYGVDDKAGCELVWRNFSDNPLPEYVKLLSMYDCWINKDEEYWNNKIEPFQMGMRTENMKPNTEEGWRNWEDIFWLEKGNEWKTEKYYDMKSYLEKKIELGKKIMKYQDEMNKSLMERAFELEFEGLKIIAVNGYKGSLQFKSKWNSGKYDAMMSFYNTENRNWSISLYSDNPKLDLSVIAKKWGGGGHPSACGFQVEDITKVIGEIK